MDSMDMNLLAAFDALLAEGSVTGAARRLGLSTSAMSRTLARLRLATGDPLLVRAGRGMVPTPRASELRDRVHELTRDVRAVLTPNVSHLDVATLQRTFAIRANEAFLEVFASAIVAAVVGVAPRVRLHFAPKPNKDAFSLRDGAIDLEIGVLGASAPEVRRRFLFRDDFIGAVRTGHPLLAWPMTPDRYVAYGHIVASRRGAFAGPVDDALQTLGLCREVVAVVPGFPDAMRIARDTDLIALIPRSCLVNSQSNAASIGQGLAILELPVRTPEIVISAMWHPRMDSDPAHRWLRDTVMTVCNAAMPPQRGSRVAPAN
ncbi:LysR family transcriptional regulator [Paroceanicella profunda]|uniref:LysR family transcriptional regulator n=1 Tax=Paroceanicella profunda TaxID=2579971 RepID=A0A5B8FIF2_9RHOB|nr:LysR family transcriptional regulator [Paroceanicella profunda]QDL93177.1 LysR family transcriptional regulator [Paroceanicella profunda]